jgi:hypothetical protein
LSDERIVHLIGGVEGIERFPDLAEQIGRYLVDYQPERAKQDEQWLWTSEKEAEAKRFTDLGELHAYLYRSIGTRPWDGRPDRPITVFHIEIRPPSEEVTD